MCQKKQGVEKWLKKNPQPFPLWVDESREAAKALGIHVPLGLDSLNIARPASFLIAKDATVKFLYIGKNSKDRLPPAELLSACKESL